VLVAGGVGSGAPEEAKMYDPVTGQWTYSGIMTAIRIGHTSSVLKDGKVLVAGGTDDDSVLRSAELYDPSTDLWTSTDIMMDARDLSAVSVLSNGKVLVTGGYSDLTMTSLNSSELYDSSTALWTSSGNMKNA
jgi:N-acetylneuraminic acid mutarotase